MNEADANSQDSATVDSANDDAGATMNFVAINNLVAVKSGIRLCFAASNSDNPSVGDAVDMNPQPTSAMGPSVLSRISVPTSIVGKNVRIFVYYQASLDALNLSSASCSALLSQSALVASADGGAATDAGNTSATLVQTADFDVSDVISSSVFDATSKYVILPTGCPLNTDLNFIGDPYYCGNLDDAGASPYLGDFHVWAYRLDPTPGAGTNARVQGLMASQPYQYLAEPFDLPPMVFGFAYGDAAVDAAATTVPGPSLVGPVDAGDEGGTYYGYYFVAANQPLSAGTDVPSLSSISATYQYVPPIGGPAVLSPYPIDQVLAASGLTESDLGGSDYTLVYVGDPELPTTADDGGANPFNGMRLIKNDSR